MSNDTTFFTEPSSTALLVVDMQNDFVAPPAELATPNGTKIVPVVRDLADACRRSGLPVIYTKEMHRANHADFGIERYFEPMHCIEGTRGSEIVDGLTPGETDYLVTSKRRYDAFLGTELDVLLRCLRVDNLIITGVCTDICVTATTHHARNLDYRCFVVSDAVDGTSDERHNAALLNLSHVWAHIGDSDEVMELFELGAKPSV